MQTSRRSPLASTPGRSGTTLAGAGSLNNPTTYRIGANGASTTFSGAIANGSGITNIVKIGTGIWIRRKD